MVGAAVRLQVDEQAVRGGRPAAAAAPLLDGQGQAGEEDGFDPAVEGDADLGEQG